MPVTILNRRQCMAASLSALASSAAGAAPSAAGVVRTVSGLAEAESGTAVRRLAQDGSVYIGDRIATASGARASFALGEATELRLGEAARIRIDRFIVNAGGVIDLEAGALGLDRDPGRERGPLNIRSSYGLIAVRGTRFFAGPSGGVFGVFVERGSVAIRGGGKQVVLQAGEGTDIAQPGSRPSQPSRWGAARIQGAWAQVF